MSIHKGTIYLKAERSKGLYFPKQTAFSIQMYSSIEVIDVNEGQESSCHILGWALELGETVTSRRLASEYSN